MAQCSYPEACGLIWADWKGLPAQQYERSFEELFLLDLPARQLSLRRDGTLILLFIFLTPQLWNYGDKPAIAAATFASIQVIGDGQRGCHRDPAGLGCEGSRRAQPTTKSRRRCRQANEPVTGDPCLWSAG